MKMFYWNEWLQMWGITFKEKKTISISLVFLFFWNGTYQKWHFTSIRDHLCYCKKLKKYKNVVSFLRSYFQLSYLALMWSPERVLNKQKEYTSQQCNDLQPSPKVVLVVLPYLERSMQNRNGKAGIRESCFIFQVTVVSTASLDLNSGRCFFFTLTVSTE